jgi:hypothetical protein
MASGAKVIVLIKKINKEDIEFASLSFIDDIGRVFFWEERVFRAIKQGADKRVRALFSCGLIDELVENNIFPKSWITNYNLEGYALVLEHERYFPVTYPYEWSFSMLQDAAITILKTNIIARKYGYQTKDCHGFNIVFDGCHPKFIDLGSFVNVSDEFRGWLAYEEFLGCYYYPLSIWKDGNSHIARKILQGHTTMPHISYLLYRFTFCRILNLIWLEKAARLFYKLKTFSPQFSVVKEDGYIKSLVRQMASKNMLPFMKVDLHAWVRKIRKLSPKCYVTIWGGYHDEFCQEEAILSTPRFDRIVKIVKNLKPSSILELAGNQGILSMLLVDELPGVPVICTDYDENAVDIMYQRLKERNINVYPALLDFMYPTLIAFGANPSDRFRADVVLALAVSHHLLLNGCMPIEVVFRTLSSYSRKYVLVEFMPLGLYDGSTAPPLPEWYTLDWFRGNFTQHYDLLQEEKLEENRIVFVGVLKKVDRN